MRDALAAAARQPIAGFCNGPLFVFALRLVVDRAEELFEALDAESKEEGDA